MKVLHAPLDLVRLKATAPPGRLGDMLVALAEGIFQVEASCRELGIGLRDYRVLAVVAQGEADRQLAIASATGIHPTSLPSIMAHLVRAGYLAVEQGDHKRRGRQYVTTSAGRTTFEITRAEWSVAEQQCLDKLNSSERNSDYSIGTGNR